MATTAFLRAACFVPKTLQITDVLIATVHTPCKLVAVTSQLVTIRHGSFFNKKSSDEMWDSVTSVSNQGRMRGRASRGKLKKKVNFYVGEKSGEALLKSKPSTLAAFQADTEWASDLDGDIGCIDPSQSEDGDSTGDPTAESETVSETSGLTDHDPTTEIQPAGVTDCDPTAAWPYIAGIRRDTDGENDHDPTAGKTDHDPTADLQTAGVTDHDPTDTVWPYIAGIRRDTDGETDHDPSAGKTDNDPTADFQTAGVMFHDPTDTVWPYIAGIRRDTDGETDHDPSAGKTDNDPTADFQTAVVTDHDPTDTVLRYIAGIRRDTDGETDHDPSAGKTDNDPTADFQTAGVTNHDPTDTVWPYIAGIRRDTDAETDHDPTAGKTVHDPTADLQTAGVTDHDPTDTVWPYIAGIRRDTDGESDNDPTAELQTAVVTDHDPASELNTAGETDHDPREIRKYDSSDLSESNESSADRTNSKNRKKRKNNLSKSGTSNYETKCNVSEKRKYDSSDLSESNESSADRTNSKNRKKRKHNLVESGTSNYETKCNVSEKRKYDRSDLSESNESSADETKSKNRKKRKHNLAKSGTRNHETNCNVSEQRKYDSSDLSESNESSADETKSKNKKKRKHNLTKSGTSNHETKCNVSEKRKYDSSDLSESNESCADRTNSKNRKKRKQNLAKSGTSNYETKCNVSEKRKYDSSDLSESNESCADRTNSKNRKKRKHNLAKSGTSNYDTKCNVSEKRKYDSSDLSESNESSADETKSKNRKKMKNNLAKSGTRNHETMCNVIERHENEISKKYRKKDINNDKIYVRKLMTSKFKTGGIRKKSERVWNQVHACKFCSKVRSNIAKHLKKHRNEHEVKETIKLSKETNSRNKVVRAMWDCMRNEGDHLHNVKVLEEGNGEIILGRRFHGRLDISSYGPCPGCKVWIRLDKTLYRHQHICPALITGATDFRDASVKVLRIQAMQLTGQISPSASILLVKEVYTIMTNDNITAVAQADPLIVSLGNLWMLKNAGNQLKRKYYTSSRMRGAARLLLNIQKVTDVEETFCEFLKPEHFDNVVKATLLTASPDMDDEEDLKAPSTALKLGYDIKRLAGAKWAMALRNKENDVAIECKDFMKLMKFEWSVKVAKLASTTLIVRRFNADKSLPEPDDLHKLQNHVKEGIKTLDLNDYSPAAYRRAEILAQTRLLMYNKRRSGEVEVISVKDYMKRVTGVSEVDKAMREHLSPLEIKLLDTQDVMEVRGKLGRGVPVIVTEDLREVLQYMVNAEVREKAGVLSTNKYLFPNSSVGVIRSYDSLKTMCKEVDLRNPTRLTSVNLRKYTATISQIFDLSPQQQTWLTNHLGHSLDIHKIHYRQTSSVIERVDVAKLMLMQELNVTAKYAGKKLEDIQLPEMVFGADAEVENISQNMQEESVALDIGHEESVEDFQPNLMKDDTYDEYEFNEEDEADEQRKRRNKGPAGMKFPGLNTPVLDKEGKKLSQLSKPIEQDGSYAKRRDEKLAELYKGTALRSGSLHPLDRGYTSKSSCGTSVGAPNPVDGYTFDGFDTRILEKKFVANMTSTLGVQRSFWILAMTGNNNGLVGLAIGKGKLMRAATVNAKSKASQRLVYVERYKDHTVYHNFTETYHRTRVIVTKKEKGYGLVCHRVIKTICELVGITDIHVKAEGRVKNTLSLARAFLTGLLNQTTFQDFANQTGHNVVEYNKNRDFYPVVVASPNTETKSDFVRDENFDFDTYFYGGKLPLDRKKPEPFYAKEQSWVKKTRVLRWERLQYEAKLQRIVHGLESAYNSKGAGNKED